MSTRDGRPVRQMRCRGSGVATGDMDFPWMCVECTDAAPPGDESRFDEVMRAVDAGSRPYIVRQDDVRGAVALPLRRQQLITHSSDGSGDAGNAFGRVNDLPNDDAGVVATASVRRLSPGPPLHQRPTVSYDNHGPLNRSRDGSGTIGGADYLAAAWRRREDEGYLGSPTGDEGRRPTPFDGGDAGGSSDAAFHATHAPPRSPGVNPRRDNNDEGRRATGTGYEGNGSGPANRTNQTFG